MSEQKRDRRAEFGISSVHGWSDTPTGDPQSEWRITGRQNSYSLTSDPIVWRHPFNEADWDDPHGYPAHVREAYERLIGYEPDARSEQPFNVVELVADEGGGFDQPCAHGNRIEDHAVYCHNTQWLYAPRKCRRSETDPKWAHAACPGFRANPNGSAHNAHSAQHELGTDAPDAQDVVSDARE